MGRDVTLYPTKATREELKDFLESSGFKPCKHLWDWPKGTLNYSWFERQPLNCDVRLHVPERPDQFLATIRGTIEARVREQVERHLRIDPNGNIGRIVEIQMQQERERLERLIEESDDSSKEAEFFVALLAWLPQLEHELKRRSR